jgi:hypothetical protein
VNADDTFPPDSEEDTLKMSTEVRREVKEECRKARISSSKLQVAVDHLFARMGKR